MNEAKNWNERSRPAVTNLGERTVHAAKREVSGFGFVGLRKCINRESFSYSYIGHHPRAKFYALFPPVVAQLRRYWTNRPHTHPFLPLSSTYLQIDKLLEILCLGLGSEQPKKKQKKVRYPCRR